MQEDADASVASVCVEGGKSGEGTGVGSFAGGGRGRLMGDGGSVNECRLRSQSGGVAGRGNDCLAHVGVGHEQIRFVTLF